MAETKNEQQLHSFKRKLGNTTYTVKVHFSKDTGKTFKDRMQKLIINECLEKNQKYSTSTLYNSYQIIHASDVEKRNTENKRERRQLQESAVRRLKKSYWRVDMKAWKNLV